MGGGPDGVLLVDKPAGVTSTRALAMTRRAVGSRKAGHTGTLDPFATGLLPLVFGEATKFSRFLIDADKTYVATLRLGTTTTTGDPEGEIVSRSAVEISVEEIQAASKEFIGVSAQIPPMHSAVRVQGKRLYDLARQGIEVARDARLVRIDDLDILSFFGEKLVISVKCSKGTYIRTLAEAIGQRLGCGAYLTELRRTASGGFSIEDAATPEALLDMGPAAARARLLPVEVLVASLPRTVLDEGQAWAIRNGQELPAGGDWEAGERALFAGDGGFIGVGRVDHGKLVVSRLLSTGNPG